MDSVLIEGLRVRAHVGVPVEERQNRQSLVLDLEMGLDLASAGRSDRVDQTVDYAAVARQVKQLVEAGSFRLVEAVAEQAAQAVLRSFRADWVRVRVRKFSVPGAASVGVEVTRGKRRTTSRSPRTGPR